METLSELQRRMQSASELYSVVKTMKTLAAVHIRQYERSVDSLSIYNRTVDEALGVALRARPADVPLPEPVPTGVPMAAVVFGSQQGLSGQFNESIAEHALERMEELSPEVENRFVLAMGGFVGPRLRARGQPVEQTLNIPSAVRMLGDSVQEMLLRVRRWNEERGIERVLVFYHVHLSGASFKPRGIQLLPPDTGWLSRLERSEWESRSLPTFTMKWRPLFSALVREHLFISLYRAAAESLASENASRLQAMQAAEKNIEERLDELDTLYHHERQSAITAELLDIAGGFVALTEDSGGRPGTRSRSQA
jgi:F-type H+-transporting ATPase subunit gamma